MIINCKFEKKDSKFKVSNFIDQHFDHNWDSKTFEIKNNKCKFKEEKIQFKEIKRKSYSRFEKESANFIQEQSILDKSNYQEDHYNYENSNDKMKAKV